MSGVLKPARTDLPQCVCVCVCVCVRVVEEHHATGHRHRPFDHDTATLRRSAITALSSCDSEYRLTTGYGQTDRHTHTHTHRERERERERRQENRFFYKLDATFKLHAKKLYLYLELLELATIQIKFCNG